MELNENPTPEGAHHTILRIVTSVFSGPYLPFSLIVFLALAILTEYAYVLMREPLAYWFDYSREALGAQGGFQFGPFVALGVILVYTALVGSILRILNRRISLILWSGLVFFHLSAFIIYPPTCNYGVQQIIPGWLCNSNYVYLIALIIGIIIGLALSRGGFREEARPAGEPHPGSFISNLGLSRRSIIFSVLWLIALGAGIGIASHIPANGWRPAITKHTPSPRYEAMVAYDTRNNKAILFGGSIEIRKDSSARTNDTWEWNGTDWAQLNPQHSPPARGRGAMAYDPKRNVIILFGGWDNLGKSLNDTWIWDGNTWKEADNCDTCNPPPSRGCHNMFYDAVREEVVLYGGCNEYQLFFNDAWGWNGNTWQPIAVQKSPTISGAPVVYDPKSEWAIGFIAWQPSGTWIWDKNGWYEPALTTQPPLRGNAMMANNPATGNSLLFGGTKTENNLTTFYEDTWLINGRTWSEVKTSLEPPGRWGHVIFFDTKLNKFILFGGFDGKAALDDTWEFSDPPNK